MGNYVFSADALIDAVTRDDTRPGSKHDMGGDIIPDLVERGEAAAYDFNANEVPGATDRDRAYWRDVGTLDSYYDAHMDLTSIHPIFNLYNFAWPIYTHQRPFPPAKFVHGDQGRFGEALNSCISSGVVISGARVNNSIVSPGCHVHSYTTVDDSVLLDGVDVGRHVELRKVIVDKDVTIPEGTKIGIDPEHDRARGFVVTESGLTVVGKGQSVVP